MEVVQINFLTADVLKRQFEVKGSFYNVFVGDKQFECRNYVKIYSKESDYQEKYDALFILVNPGKCMPKQSTYKIPQIKVSQTSENYTLAKTDNTQYQIMRFMKLKKWNKVLLINLSDIRAGNMDTFKEKLNEAKKVGFNRHSIFSPERKGELKSVLSKINGPIILAWGTNRVIKELAFQAIKSLPKDRIIGMEHEERPFYYHASPTPLEGKLRWLEHMDEKLI